MKDKTKIHYFKTRSNRQYKIEVDTGKHKIELQSLEELPPSSFNDNETEDVTKIEDGAVSRGFTRAIEKAADLYADAIEKSLDESDHPVARERNRADWFISLALPYDQSEDIIANLEEIEETWIKEYGETSAKWMYRRAAAGVILSYWAGPMKKFYDLVIGFFKVSNN